MTATMALAARYDSRDNYGGYVQIFKSLRIRLQWP